MGFKMLIRSEFDVTGANGTLLGIPSPGFKIHMKLYHYKRIDFNLAGPGLPQAKTGVILTSTILSILSLGAPNPGVRFS